MLISNLFDIFSLSIDNIIETTYLETAHASNTFALNDGRALRVIVRPMALWSSMCSSIEGIASKRRQIESSGIKELYQQVFVSYAGSIVLFS